MKAVGYGLLQERLGLALLPLSLPAAIQPVTRLKRIGEILAVPSTLAPPAEDLLAHVLFALKHQGVNLALLAQALPKIPVARFERALETTPHGTFIRKACYLREAFAAERIRQPVPINGRTIGLFDPKQYLTRPGQRDPKWRVEFNGLGDLTYCAIVERTPQLTELLGHDVLGRTSAFMQTLTPGMMDRAIQWAYLSETKDSFAIEREAPSEDKSRRFIRLLRQAHERQPLTEDYLVTLQNATIDNPYDLAAAFRHDQNYLAGPLQGSAGVTYVPPPADLCRELMESLMVFANEAPTQIDPLVAAGIISFGFVFLHPFADGNGRLSRFLIHQALCRAGALDNGLLLPISAAMKREERQYLEALQGFSSPVRALWEVQWVDAGKFIFDFQGDESVYRYWDATACVTFTLKMALRALEVELKEETIFLANYDAVYKAIDERFDVRGSELSQLVMMCLTNQGTVSKNRRKQFQYRVPEEVFDVLEALTRQVIAGRNDSERDQLSS